MFIPDTPISAEPDDLLGRAGFARQLGETIRTWDGKESIVIALYGPWGSGKTSILNLAVAHIEATTRASKEKKAPIIVRFNPWNFSEQGLLLLSFFQQLNAAIKKAEPRDAQDLQKDLGRLLKTLSKVEITSNIPLVGPVITGTIKTFAVFFPDETLDDQREKINALLRKLDRRIIVVVDDIDRLSSQEIRQLFQLIKVNADFPNTIYLVAFDRLVVEKALDTEQGIAGRDYLKKIVQVGFDIPAMEIPIIEQQLFSGLDQILASTKFDLSLWNPARWQNLYQGGIRPLFQSMRDVKRFLSGVAFTFTLVAADINPVDFIGLEAIRIFAPELYTAISKNKVLFTQPVNLFGDRRDQGKIKQALDEAFNLVPEELRQTSINIGMQLFPKVAQVYRPMFSSDHHQINWRQARRICSEDTFDFYFVLGTPKGEVSRTELQSIANISSNYEQLVEILRALHRDGKFFRFLHLLSDIHDNFTQEQARNFCSAISDIGEEIPNQRLDFLRNTDLMMAIEINFLLRKLDPQERCRWFEEQVQSQGNIFMPVYLAWQDSPNENGLRPTPLFPDECYQDLKCVCVAQMEKRAIENRLHKVKNWGLLFLRWKDWATDDDKIRVFIESMLAFPKTALELLIGFLVQSNSQIIGEHAVTGEWVLNLAQLGEFLDVGALTAVLDPISVEEAKQISEQHALALEIFRKALNTPSERN